MSDSNLDLRKVAGVQRNPIQFNKDERMRMLRVADEVDSQWREAVQEIISTFTDSDPSRTHYNPVEQAVIELRDFEVKASR